MVLEVCHADHGGEVVVLVVVVMSPVRRVPGRIQLISHMMNRVYRGVRGDLARLSRRYECRRCYSVSIDSQLLIHSAKGREPTLIDLV